MAAQNTQNKACAADVDSLLTPSDSTRTKPSGANIAIIASAEG